MLQLSAKALLRPFMNPKEKDPQDEAEDDIDIPEDLVSHLGEEEGTGGEEEEEEEEEDPFEALSEEERKKLMTNTEEVRDTIKKVRVFLSSAQCFTNYYDSFVTLRSPS